MDGGGQKGGGGSNLEERREGKLYLEYEINKYIHVLK